MGCLKFWANCTIKSDSNLYVSSARYKHFTSQTDKLWCAVTWQLDAERNTCSKTQSATICMSVILYNYLLTFWLWHCDISSLQDNVLCLSKIWEEQNVRFYFRISYLALFPTHFTVQGFFHQNSVLTSFLRAVRVCVCAYMWFWSEDIQFKCFSSNALSGWGTLVFFFVFFCRWGLWIGIFNIPAPTHSPTHANTRTN